MVLFAIYSGFRPTELALIKNENVHLKEENIVGGMKTKAGTDRGVLIHPKIREIVEKRFNEQNEYLFSDYDMFEHEVVQLSYDKYRGRFYKVMKALKMNHNPHETRHTFITQAKHCEVDDYMLKCIIGHEIRDVTEKVYTPDQLKS